MIFKVGQKVKIRPDLTFTTYDGCSFVGGMEQYLGEKSTITKTIQTDGKTYYALEIDKGSWSWSYPMLILLFKTWREHYTDK